MSLDLLALQLGIEVETLEGMLGELVRLGRLVKVENRDASACAACGLQQGCPYLPNPETTYYALPESLPFGSACATTGLSAT